MLWVSPYELPCNTTANGQTGQPSECICQIQSQSTFMSGGEKDIQLCDTRHIGGNISGIAYDTTPLISTRIISLPIAKLVACINHSSFKCHQSRCWNLPQSYNFSFKYYTDTSSTFYSHPAYILRKTYKHH